MTIAYHILHDARWDTVPLISQAETLHCVGRQPRLSDVKSDVSDTAADSLQLVLLPRVIQLLLSQLPFSRFAFCVQLFWQTLISSRLITNVKAGDLARVLRTAARYTAGSDLSSICSCKAASPLFRS